jgi:hypothetical protein
VETFLSTVDSGRTITTYQMHQKVFSQADPADSVFYIRRATPRSASYPSGGYR